MWSVGNSDCIDANEGYVDSISIYLPDNNDGFWYASGICYNVHHDYDWGYEYADTIKLANSTAYTFRALGAADTVIIDTNGYGGDSLALKYINSSADSIAALRIYFSRSALPPHPGTIKLCLRFSEMGDLSQYYPLAVGYKWQYEHYEIGYDHPDIKIIKIVDETDTVVNGDSVTSFTTLSIYVHDDSDPAFSYVRVYQGQIWRSKTRPYIINGQSFSGDYNSHNGGTLNIHTSETVMGHLVPVISRENHMPPIWFGRYWAYGIGYYSHWNDESSTRLVAYYVGGDTVGVFDTTIDSMLHALEETPNIPEDYRLQCYPNPFNNTINIYISLPSSSMVDLKIFDLRGRRVKVIEHALKSAGEYHYQESFENYASGIYIVRMRTDDQTMARKILYLK